MQRSLLILAAFIIFGPASLSAAGQDAKPQLQSLRFMAGCWQMDVPGRKVVISEQWMEPAGDAMLGMNRTLTDGKMSSFEYLRIIQRGDSLFYVALPSENDTPTSFELKSLGKNEVVFENLGHDFPQMITYTAKGPNAIVAAVEGLGSERPKRRRMEFPMKRVKCS